MISQELVLLSYIREKSLETRVWSLKVFLAVVHGESGLLLLLARFSQAISLGPRILACLQVSLSVDSIMVARPATVEQVHCSLCSNIHGSSLNCSLLTGFGFIMVWIIESLAMRIGRETRLDHGTFALELVA
jgi:hypothetical protein